MAMVRERVREDPTRRRVRVLPVRPVGTRRPLSGPVEGGWAARLGLAWVVLFTAALALEPAPAQPQTVVPLYADVIGATFMAFLFATAAGLTARRRWGVAATIGGAVRFLGMSVACPATGHHDAGMWWIGQLACATALLGASAVAWRRA